MKKLLSIAVLSALGIGGISFAGSVTSADPGDTIGNSPVQTADVIMTQPPFHSVISIRLRDIAFGAQGGLF